MWACRAEEISDFLETGKKISEQEIEKRKKIYVVWLREGRIEFYSGEEAAKLAGEQVGWGEKITGVSAEGTVASQGIARGRARIVLLRDLNLLIRDLNAFQKGEIMITSMTQPTMVTIAKKAAAIVADEGGVTSHAAVIAREFNIPCIVGAKIATKIFKTGDLVEVDAFKGTVRKVG